MASPEPIPQGDFERIYPTENDIGFADYNGVNSTEVNFSKNLHWRNPHNCILSNLDGGGLPLFGGGFSVGAGGALSVTAVRGRAYINGRYIEMLDGLGYTFDCDADTDNYIFLQLSISGVVNTSPPANFNIISVAHGAKPTIPVDSVLLAMAETDATDVLNVIDYRPSQINNSLRFEIDGVVDANLVPTKRRIKVPPEDIGLCGFFNVFNSLNNNSLTIDYDLIATGPNGTETLNVTGSVVPASGSLQDFQALEIPADLGRFEGGIIEIELTNIVKISGVGTAEVSTINNKLTHIQDVASTWALKEWPARG